VATTNLRTVFQRAGDSLSEIIRNYRDTKIGFYLLLAPATLVILLLLVTPALVLIEISFRPFTELQIQGGVTLDHYRRALMTDLYQNVIIRTLRVSLSVTVLTFLLGFPLAYMAVRKGGWVGTVIVLATLLPLMVDLVIRTFGWFVLLQRQGVIISALTTVGVVSPDNPPGLLFNETAMIIALTHVHLPFMVFPLISVIHTIPEELEEAALDLGGGRITVFRKVLFPLSMPGITAGILITFALTMASYVTPALLGGDKKMIAVVITQMFTRQSNWPFAAALATVLFVIAACMIILYGRALTRVGELGEI